MRRCKIAHSPQLLHFAEQPARVSRPLHKNLTNPETVRNNADTCRSYSAGRFSEHDHAD